ncbi:MAG: GIY-YIG nuclease family protein [Bacteroidota bacterium]
MRPKEIFSKFKGNFENFEFEKLMEKNPTLWKKLKKQFDTGRQIIQVQLSNGLDRLNEKTLRSYLIEYANRFIKYGPNSFPTSFNVLEPFFTFNPFNSIIQLIEEEESYGVSLLDFLDYVTQSDFSLDNIDFYENIPEKMIYHFSFTTGFDEINFSNSQGKTFIIGSLSLIRQGNEVSMLMQAGESYDKQEAEEYFKNHTRKTIEESISPFKKSLGFEMDNHHEEPKIVYFEGRDDLWLHSIALLFDLENKSIDIRHVARDENISYNILTDDYAAMFSRQNSLTKEERKEHFERYLNKLRNYDAVFDFAKYCLALPYYVFENEKRIVDVTYQTDLNSIIKGPISKKQYASVPEKLKIHAKPFYYLESSTQVVLKETELNDKSFKIETSGYWKRVGFDEEGFDKSGRKIFGKTWVERNDVYYSSPKGITTIKEIDFFDNENAGYIYIMRQAAHEEHIFKIGLTKRSVKSRSNELSNTSSVDKFFVVNSYYTKDCIDAEKQIHKELKMYRLTSRREFFRCNLKIIMDTCERITNKINK